MDGPCNRCGRCCHWFDRVSGILKRCKYLIRHRNGLTSCRIYKNRLGKKIGKNGELDVFCVLRSKVSFDYAGCPQNKTNQ